MAAEFDCYGSAATIRKLCVKVDSYNNGSWQYS